MENKKSKILSYYAVFEPNELGGYNISFPDFPGCITFGRNLNEAKKMAKEVLELWLEELSEQKVKIPKKSVRPIIDEVHLPFAYA